MSSIFDVINFPLDLRAKFIFSRKIYNERESLTISLSSEIQKLPNSASYQHSCLILPKVKTNKYDEKLGVSVFKTN